MSSTYAFHPEAALELEGIQRFIARDSIDAADRVAAEIVDELDAIARAPHAGHTRPDLRSRAIRFRSAYQYLIAYAPNKEPIRILGIFDGRRDPRKLASLLRRPQ